MCEFKLEKHLSESSIAMDVGTLPWSDGEYR